MGKNTPQMMKEEVGNPKREKIVSALVSLRNKHGTACCTAKPLGEPL
jgi:hypothetical protein